MSARTKAKCRLCSGEYTKGGFSRHLHKCIPTHEPRKGGEQTLYLLRIEGRYDPQYWMHIEMASTEKFGLLDEFLRRIWLECCGHMSAFQLEVRRGLPSNPFDFSWGDEEDPIMGMALGEVLLPKMAFHYEYDFGSSTYLTIHVVSVREGTSLREPVIVLTRNEPPRIPCDYCGKKLAVALCPVCSWNEKGWVCGGCRKKHRCGEGVWMGVVNSPRVGVCGYETESDEEAVMRSLERKKPTSEALAKYDEVRALLRKYMKSPFTKGERQKALEVWDAFAQHEVPQVRSPGVYAASVEYLIGVTSGHEKITQSSVAKKYKTTPVSISQNYGDINLVATELGLLRDGDDGGDTILFMSPMVKSPEHMLEVLPDQLRQFMELMLGESDDDEGLLIDREQERSLRELPMIEETWLGGSRTFSLPLRDDLGAPPEACFWTTPAGHPLFVQKLLTFGDTAQSLLDSVIQAMHHPGLMEPGRRRELLLANEEYVEPFQKVLQEYGIEVKRGGEKIIDAIHTLMEARLKHHTPEPTYLEHRGVTEKCVAALFEACAELYLQAPWNAMGDAQPFCVDLQSWGLGRYCVCIMGAAGINRGMLIFTSLADFEQFYQLARLPGHHPSNLKVQIRAINFEEIGEVSARQRRESIENGWTFAATDAFPDFHMLDPNMNVLPLEDNDFLIAIGCAWAVAAYTKKYRKHLRNVDDNMSDTRDVILIEPIEMEVETTVLEQPPITVSLPHPERVQGIENPASTPKKERR